MYEDIFELVTIAAQKRNLKESTSHRYCQALTPFLKASNKPWQELTIEDADDYLTAKRLAGIMPETYNHYYGAIRFMYYKMSRPNVQKILYKNVQLVCLSQMILQSV